MQFSDTTHAQGLIQDITFFSGVDLNKYSIENRTRNINLWNSTVWTWIFEAYGGWQFDDDNNSATDDMPSSSINLVSGTSVYGLPSSALTVRKAEILQSDGSTSVSLAPLPIERIPGAEADFMSTDSTPAYYRLVGDVVKLYPAPDYSVASGLTLFYDRDMAQFVKTDTTKTPGFASPFHRVLSVGASLDYAEANGSAKRVSSLSRRIDNFEKRIKKFYAKRFLANFPNKIRVPDSLRQYQ